MGDAAGVGVADGVAVGVNVGVMVGVAVCVAVDVKVGVVVGIGVGTDALITIAANPTNSKQARTIADFLGKRATVTA